MVRQAAQRTAEVAGDGTTTATILARTMFNEGVKAIAAGYNVVGVKQGIDKAVDKCLELITDHAQPCKTKKELTQVATIAANSDKVLGELIATAKHKLGKDASITVEMGRQSDTIIEYVEGLRYEEGYASPYFVTNQRHMKVDYEDAYIMVIDYKIRVIHEMVDILNEVVSEGRPLLIVMNHYEPEVLNTLAVNNMQGKLRVCVTHFPMGFAEDDIELAKDIASLTGATVLGHNTGVDVRKAKLEHLGQAKRVIITRQDTTIVGGVGTKKEIDNRISQIEDFREKIKNQPGAEKTVTYLTERIAKFRGGVAQISAGGSTDLEMRETRDRIEDAIFAVQAASEEGVVPGGGTLYVHVSKLLGALTGTSDEKVGFDIVIKALYEPAAQIAKNSGYEPNITLERIKDCTEATTGFNAAKGTFENLVTAGIIDPVKVTKAALKNAASVATLLLTTEVVVVTDFPKEDK